MKHECEVSVLCTTYNQSRYLRKALDSILSQVTDYSFEVIIHDDASNDRTQSIIKSYIQEYPSIVKGLFEDENQYSKGVDFFYPLVTDVARGKYIALCEGDDFWIDDMKLQRQWEALEVHPECDMCACCGIVVAEDGETEVGEIRPADRDCILSAEQVIKGGGQYMITAGLFFRRSLFAQKQNFENILSLDYVYQIKGSLCGGIYYIDRKMAAYRRYSEGSWTNNVLMQPQKLKEHWIKETQMLQALDRDTNGKYHDVIVERLRAYVPFEQQLKENETEIFSLMQDMRGSCYIWGMGRRGKGLEHFFSDNGILVDGICDAVNKDVGMKTEYGNKIFSTDETLSRADNILASTSCAYIELMNNGFSGRVYDFQQYMPNG